MTAESILIPVSTCKKCGESNFREDGRCRTCQRISHLAWVQNNAEKMRAYRNKYLAANKDVVAAKRREYKENNKEKIKKADALYRQNNAEKKRIATAVWYSKNKVTTKLARARWNEANKERKKELNTAWCNANPDAKRAHCQNRRARIAGDGGKLSTGLAKKLFELQKGKCPCCAEPLGDDFHMDHKVPLVMGGTNTDDNIQLLRKLCNHKKGTKHPVDFMQERGFLL